eukprot:364990-Chlamydomonas_euryale.AAC.6
MPPAGTSATATCKDFDASRGAPPVTHSRPRTSNAAFSGKRTPGSGSAETRDSLRASASTRKRVTSSRPSTRAATDSLRAHAPGMRVHV